VQHLQDKVCVITGGAGMIGRAAVEIFRREGAKVAAVDIKHDDVDADLLLTADLTEPAQVEALYAAVSTSHRGATD